jgi:dienelactone hydrolase
MTRTAALALTAALAAACSLSCAEESPRISLTEALVLPGVGKGGRSPVHTDALELEIVHGRWQGASPGDEVTLPDGSTRSWVRVAANDEGWIGHPEARDGYVLWEPEVPEGGLTGLLVVEGSLLVYVNGAPRAGNPYRKRYVELPIHLTPERREILVRYGRGAIRARIEPIEPGIRLSSRDGTFPDLIAGAPTPRPAALLVQNATPERLEGARIQARIGDRSLETPIGRVPAWSVRKVGFVLPAADGAAGDELTIELELLSAPGDVLASHTLDRKLAAASAPQQHTFWSTLDGSVQYYGLRPARPRPGNPRAPALFLSLHGASVEAIGQARSYSSKTWGHVVAPTNRRPFGFDWEDWGRLDAIEVLELAQTTLRTDPLRTYLTGHSMGGHGTWHLGVTFPDRFAVIAPSAGWISFWSYTGAARFEGQNEIERILTRATSPSDTLALAGNTHSQGVYVLHGDADDNVPVEQARQMKAELGATHPDFHYHEQPGAGHWWDASKEPGSACVDWPPIFDLFARRSLPPEILHVRFTTASPGVSAECHWVRVEAQQRDLDFSTVDLRLEPGLRRIAGTTANVRRLSLDLSRIEPAEVVNLDLDGRELEVPWPDSSSRLVLGRDDDGSWRADSPAPPALKGPHRYGPFKNAFRNHMCFVVGTQGTDEENAWALAKAVFDAETWWVRGNGAVDIYTDQQLDQITRDRAIVLYGNADTNAAWEPLLGSSPIQVRRGEVTLGERRLEGDDLLCLFVQPRPGSHFALVAAFAGTGLPGMRLADRLPVFVSGIAYPDVLVLDTSMLERGVDGVRAAGFLGEDWSLDGAELAIEVE